MKRVYILQDMKNHDYSVVEEYGQPVFVGDKDINSRFQIMGTPHNRQVIRNMFQVLKQFEDGDYVVVSGNPVMVSLALHYLVVMRELQVKLLKWDNRAMEYCVLDYPGVIFNDRDLFQPTIERG